ncbi:MAG: hypothetical protein HY363_02300 [Candidatus Aenigmarchaeota archaeon]|nr:hypothetical protein [Candidatus Aenigmarchaeota archaeon]
MKVTILLALVFSLTLVVSLPFVQASTLQITLLSGKDKINGYAKSNDELVLEVLAAIDGDDAVTPEQVRISVDSAVVFPQKCRQNEKGFLCTYNEPIVNRKEANAYGIILVDDAGENILQAGQSLVIDDAPPAILIFDLQEITGGAGTIEYNLQDGNDVKSCSGIKNVQLSITDTIISEKTFEPETCSAHEALAYEYRQNGEVQLCIKATDYLDQKTELCRKIIIDTEPPTLLSAGVYENGKQIKHIKPEGGLFSIGATLQDASGILPENIILTLDKITGKPVDVRIPTRVVNSTYFVDNIPISQNSACEGSVTATDKTGHVLQTNFQCQLSTDNTGPEPVLLKTNFLDANGGYLLSTQNPKIIAEIKEEQSGLSQHKVYLNLFSITGESSRQADNCVNKTPTIWQCEWNNLAIKGKLGQHTITLVEDSTDDLGNRLQKEIKQDIEATTLTTGITELQHSPKYPSNTDTIFFSFFATPPEIMPTVVVNASTISRGPEIQKAQCTPSAGKWQCSVKIANLKPAEKTTVEFTLSNEQGNTVNDVYPIEIFEANPTQQKFFTLTGVMINPSLGIDRRTATKTAYPVSIQPFLNAKDKSVEIISQTIRCDETLLAENPLIMNEKSKSPYVLLKFDGSISEEKEDVVRINCATSIITKRDRTVFTTPEILNFTARIPLYNNPLGTIDESVQKKLDAVNNHIKSIEDEIGSWQDANKALGITAGIAQTLAQTDAMSNILHGVLSIVSQVLIITGNTLTNAGQPAGAVLIGLGIGVWGGCNVQANIHKLLLLSVWTPGPPTANNPLFKMASFINSCQLCRHSGEYTLPVEKLTGQIIANIDGKTGIPTSTENFMQYLWEPQKSIHVASLCLCPQGIEYNLKKERQLACIYRNCIKENAKKGLPITNCDRTYKEQNCAYIDSAGWKVGGSSKLAKTFAAMSLTTIIEKIPEIISGLAWQMACHPVFGLMTNAYTCSTYPYGATNEIAIKNIALAAVSASTISASVSPAAAVISAAQGAAETKAASEATSVEEIVCSMTSAPSMLMESEFLQGNKFNWNQYNAELTGVDYCD